MTKLGPDMTITYLTGTAREMQIDRAGGCRFCGFMEEGLHCYTYCGETVVQCQECFIQTDFDHAGDVQAVYLPELQPRAFSTYVRTLAWLTFAARADRLAGHDFVEGTLPACFSGEGAWSSAMRWTSLSEGLADPYAGAASKAGLRQARDAFLFVASRIEMTKGMHGTTSPAPIRAAVGDEVFFRDYRRMAAGVPTGRIRSWGRPGSTFRLLAARTENKRR